MEAFTDARPFQLYGDEAEAYVPDLVHLETIAARASLHNWFIGAHRHPTILQLLYIEEGRGTMSCREGEFDLDRPSLVLSPCDCPHAFRFAPDARGWVLSVAEALLHDPRMAITGKQRFLQRDFIERIPVLAAERRQLIAALFGEIERRRLDANIRVTSGLIATLSLLFSLAQEISHAATARKVAPPSPRRALFTRFMGLVEERFRSGWTVGDYAAALGSSEATLTRACREVTRRAPAALVNDRRLLEARRSLSLTTASVKQIASDLGYDDPAYFARSFRRHIGMTATEFRGSTLRPAPELDAERPYRAGMAGS
jgi:AraC family transcriptional activator of pobA